jgi:hypothetical protein
MAPGYSPGGCAMPSPCSTSGRCCGPPPTVPPTLLRLGPEDPQSQDWLWRHWGTTRGLRHIRLLPSQADRRNRRTDHWAVEFWAADWSPWPALKALRRAWPGLSLSLRPHYDEAGDG